MKTLYRYVIEYKSIDDDTSVQLIEYPVIRETDRTYFIRDLYAGGYPPKERRVLKDAMNTFAYDTKEKAKDHFIRRTNTRIKWFEFWIEECEKGLDLMEKL